MAEWQAQQNEDEVHRLHQCVVEGKLEEDEEEEGEPGARATTTTAAAQWEDDESWKEDDIARTVEEGNAILQGVLDRADAHYMTRRNDLARECFKSARRACKVVKCAPIPVNTPYNQCCFSGTTLCNRRIQFKYVDPVHRQYSPLYTVHWQWHRFLQAIVWISCYPTWMKQYVRHLRAHKRWNRRRDLYADLSTIEQPADGGDGDEDDGLSFAFRQLQAALSVVEDILERHQKPSVGADHST